MAKCPICWEEMTNDIATFPCGNGHQFHGHCLTNHIANLLANWNGQPMALPCCPMCGVAPTRQAAQTNPHFLEAVRRRGNQMNVRVRGVPAQGIDRIGEVIGRYPNATMMAFIIFLAILVMGAKWIAENGWKPGDPFK